MLSTIPFKLTEKYADICKTNEILNEIYNDIDNYGFLSQSVALELEELLNYKDDYYIGIHRTGIQSAESIIENGGLRLTGHLSSGSPNKEIKSMNDIELNVSFYESLLLLVRELKLASNYKTYNNVGDAIIYMIPKDEDVKTIIYHDPTYGYILNNDCIYGYVHVDNGIVSEIHCTKTKEK